MSNTWVAGQTLRAENMVPSKLWTVQSSSATSNIGTSETVIASGASSTYRANRCYALHFRGLIRQNTGGNLTMTVRDTNASGTVRRLGYSYIAPPTTGQGLTENWVHYVANTSTSTDITSRVLVLTLVAGSNTGFINAASSLPWFFTCIEMGAATDFPEAVAL